MAVYVAHYCWPADYCLGKLHDTWQITGQTEVDCTLSLSLSVSLSLSLSVSLSMTFQTGVDCYR